MKFSEVIRERIVARKLGQIKLGVALAIADYPTGAVSAALLDSRTAHTAYMTYTKRRFERERGQREEAKRLESIHNRRRGYDAAHV